MKKFILAAFLVLGLATSVLAQGKDSSEFIRYKSDGPESGLQVAVTDYVCSGTTVSLFGVVHIADPDYYKKVQASLDTYDSVLYEGVGGDKQKMIEQKKKPSALSTLQHLAGDVLGLDFQLDDIDYTRKNLVHADVESMDELKEKMDGESVTPMGQYVKEEQLEFLKPILDVAGPLVKQLLKTQPKWQNDIKSKLAQSLSNSDVNAQLSPKMFKAIVLDRNEIVINVLKDQLKNHPEKRNIAIFFGAAHMSDLQKRLNTIGYTQKSKKWLLAWKIISDDESINEK